MQKSKTQKIIEKACKESAFLEKFEGLRVLYVNVYFMYPLFRNLSKEAKKLLFEEVLMKRDSSYTSVAKYLYNRIVECGLDEKVYFDPVDLEVNSSTIEHDVHFKEMDKKGVYFQRNGIVKFIEYEYVFNDGTKSSIFMKPHELWRLNRIHLERVEEWS